MRFGRHLDLAVMLALSLAASASRVSADVADIALLGDQANLMSGAVTASTQGGPSMWYNPSRLSFAAEQRYVLSVSGVGAALRLYRIPRLLVTPEQATAGETSELLVLPRATTLVVQGRGALRGGLGLFVPVMQDVTLRASQSVSVAGGEAFSALAANHRRQSIHVTGAVSYRFGPRLQLGAGVDLVGYFLYRSTQFSSAVGDAASAQSSAQANATLQRDNLGYGFSARVGASVELREHLLLGLSVGTPVKVVYATVNELGSTSSAAAGPGDDRFEPVQTEERGGTWETVEPGILRVGLAWVTDKILCEVDAEVASPADSDAFEVHSRFYGNAKAGAVVALARNLRAGIGFFTDLDSPREALKRVGDGRMQGFGGTLGVNALSRLSGQLRHEGDAKGTFSLTVTTRYVHYKGDVLTLRIDAPGQAESFATEVARSTIHELALQLGVNAAW